MALRKKTLKACTPCRNAKQRCSPTRPCQRCVQLGLPCVDSMEEEKGETKQQQEDVIEFPISLEEKIATWTSSIDEVLLGNHPRPAVVAAACKFAKLEHLLGEARRSGADYGLDFSKLDAWLCSQKERVPALLGISKIDPPFRCPVVLLKDLVVYDSILGSGAVCVVLLGTYRRLSVTVKVPTQASRMDHIDQFRREAEIAAILPAHPNVATFYGVCPELGHALVWGLCARTSVEEAQRFWLLPARLRFRIILDVAAGLAHMHDHSFVHRDIAARNIMLEENYHACIGDYGMSRAMNGQKGITTSSTCVSWNWTSPETLASAIRSGSMEYSEQTDVYSFGAAAWEVWTGKMPFGDLDHGIAIEEIVSGRAKLEIPTDAPRALQVLMRACTSYEPNSRPTFRKIVAQLELASLSM